jgi:hypothetical protein
MSPLILIIGWLLLNAAVALGVAMISDRLLGTFAEKPRLVAVPEEGLVRDTHAAWPSGESPDVRPALDEPGRRPPQKEKSDV